LDSLVFDKNNGLLMKNHGPGTHNEKMYAESSTGNTSNIPQFICPSTQIGQLFGKFLKKNLSTCPLSMILQP
jgi:hypothetical protein